MFGRRSIDCLIAGWVNDCCILVMCGEGRCVIGCVRVLFTCACSGREPAAGHTFFVCGLERNLSCRLNKNAPPVICLFPIKPAQHNLVAERGFCFGASIGTEECQTRKKTSKGRLTIYGGAKQEQDLD
jgi:hypothetical protein